MCSFIPASLAAIISSLNTLAVIAMTGTVLASFLFSFRILFVAVSPSITGIITSIKITSKLSLSDCSKSSTDSKPFLATIISAPASSRIYCATSRFKSLSSTSSIFIPSIEVSSSSVSVSSKQTVSSFTGSVIVKVLPSPCFVSRVMVPFILLIRFLTIDIPSPVP